MKNEDVKQDHVDLARFYMGNLFCLVVIGNPVSAELRHYRARVYRRNSSDVDNTNLQRYLKQAL